MVSIGAAGAKNWWTPIGITDEDAVELVGLIDNYVQSVDGANRRARLRWLADQLRSKIRPQSSNEDLI